MPAYSVGIRWSKESFLIAVEDRSAETLLPIIKNYIRQASKSYSDEWKAYQQLTDLVLNMAQFATSTILLILRQAHTLKELSQLGAWKR